MQTGIDKVVKDGNGNALIFTALGAAALANCIPTPFDGIYFARQQKRKDKLQKGEISIERYWYADVGEYYLWTALWYASLFGVIYAVGGTYKQNVRMLIGLAGAGVVLGVMAKNIQKDKEIAEMKQNQNG